MLNIQKSKNTVSIWNIKIISFLKFAYFIFRQLASRGPKAWGILYEIEAKTHEVKAKTHQAEAKTHKAEVVFLPQAYLQ